MEYFKKLLISRKIMVRCGSYLALDLYSSCLYERKFKPEIAIQFDQTCSFVCFLYSHFCLFLNNVNNKLLIIIVIRIKQILTLTICHFINGVVLPCNSQANMGIYHYGPSLSNPSSTSTTINTFFSTRKANKKWKINFNFNKENFNFNYHYVFGSMCGKVTYF